MLSTSKTLLAACVLAGVVCACSGGGTSAFSTTSSTTVKGKAPAKTTPTPTRAPTTLPPPPAKLADLILATVPSGLTREDDKIADTGPTDAAKAAETDPDPRAATALRDAGFVEGYQRTWDNPAGDQNTIFLYKFASPAGADAFARHWLSNLGAPSPGLEITPFSVLLPPPAAGVKGIYPQQTSSGVVVFTKGPYAGQAITHGAPGSDQQTPASDLATAQYGRLP